MKLVSSPLSAMTPELARRQSLASKLEAYLKARPGIWIPMHELAAVGGLGGWRTRLSELGRRKVEPMRIEHNGRNGSASRHRYLPVVERVQQQRAYVEQSLF